MDSQEAHRFMDEEFWPWFREKTYPWDSLKDSRVSCSPRNSSLRRQVWQKHLKLAGQYIRGYRKWGKVTTDNLTDAVPGNMRDKARMALGVLKKEGLTNGS